MLLPRDDDYFDTLKSRAAGKVYSFGGDDADFAIAGPVGKDGRRLEFAVNGHGVSLEAVGVYKANLTADEISPKNPEGVLLTSIELFPKGV